MTAVVAAGPSQMPGAAVSASQREPGRTDPVDLHLVGSPRGLLEGAHRPSRSAGKGLSAATVSCLPHWVQDHERWAQRSLINKRQVYLRLDTGYSHILADQAKQCECERAGIEVYVPSPDKPRAVAAEGRFNRKHFHYSRVADVCLSR